jgi:protein phosphatase
MLSVAWRTDPGAVRKINEDAVLWDADLGLLVVADGMGGHNAGEVASQMAVDTLRSVLGKSTTPDDFAWPFGVNPAFSFAANRLITAVKLANRRVYRASEEHTEYTGMGTTIVAALVDGAQVTYASIGDSRLYLLRGGELQQLTTDDSWVVMLQKESGLAANAFEKHPMRHVLTSVVGARAELDVLAYDLVLRSGDAIMLCTDGLHGALTEDAVATMLRAGPDVEAAAGALVEAAITRDGSDNVTVLLARYCA